MILNIKIQSFSDIITNSSSEIFTIQNPDKSPEEIISLLRKLSKENRHPYESCTDPKKRTELVKDYYKNKRNYNSESGDGGIIKIFSFKQRKQHFTEGFVNENKKEAFTDEIYSLFESGTLEEQKKSYSIIIDEGYQKVIEFIIKNFYVTSSSAPYIINKSGRVIGLQDDYSEPFVKQVDEE